MRAVLTGLFVLFVAFLAANALAANKIYKTVDKDGNVIFSDVPPSNSADSVKLENTNQYSTPTQPQLQSQIDAIGADSDDEQGEAAETYRFLEISAPSNDAAVRENAGNITISVDLSPALKKGDSLQIIMDGSVVQTASATSVALENVDRGSHQLIAQVIDDDGNVVISSEPITFHMLRYSQLQRRN